MAYTFHRIFCGAPWGLEDEHQAFYDAVGEFNESEAMAHGILWNPISATPAVGNLAGYQQAFNDNIRTCRYYVQILESTWGVPPRSFEKCFQVARQCAANAQSPMREVAVLWRRLPDGGAVEGKLQELRNTPPGDGLRVAEFADVASFKGELWRMLQDWLVSVLVEGKAGGAGAEGL